MMKSQLIILVINLTSLFSNSQIINIPDVNFKNALLNASPNNFTAVNCSLYNFFKIDINDNGSIEENEALNVCGLNLNMLNISNLSGIEKFTNLTMLNCNQNNLSQLNLSQLMQLTYLTCYQNQLSSLNIDSLINLKNLFFRNNQISNVDFSNNPALEVVYCGNNLLSSLDFSNNPLFHDLGCKNNPNLTTIKIYNGATQIFGTQTWLNECWDNLPNLTTICADANEIPALQNFLLGCGVSTSGININSACALGTTNFDSQAISVSPNPTKSIVSITFKEFLSEKASYEVYNVLGQKVMSNGVQSGVNNFDINLENYANGLYLLQIIIGDKKFNKSIIKQ